MKKRNSDSSMAKRISDILELLSKEHPSIRTEIANTFPAYNSLLNLHAKTFEEFALRPIAKSKDINYQDILFDYHVVIPPCPKCQTESFVVRRGQDTYWCKRCEFKFKPNYNSIASGTKQTSVVWRKILHCMLEFYSVKKTCEYCEITPTTFYSIRNRIFYAMELMMDEIKLYGNIQCDNTMAHLSFKGNELPEEEYPDDSPFGAVKLAPRNARKRGGSYKNSEKIKNQICIFTAIDENNHVLVRMIGVGAATGQRLFDAIGSLKFLYSVPETDPFSVSGQVQNNINAGSPSLLIADGENAIKNYASKIGINFESHVFRRNGKQVRLSKAAHDIQKVNSLHSRLERFLYKLNFVSSKYLPGFLTMFEFIENTGASEEAIGYLFEILAKPGFGRDTIFFENMFNVPEAQMNEKPKKKTKSSKSPISPKKIKAVHLYDMLLKQQSEELSLKYISEITGNTEYDIARLHSEVTASGEIEFVCDDTKKFALEKSKTLKSYRNIANDYLIYFDEYVKMRNKPLSEQITFKAFVKDINKKYNKEYKLESINYYFELIVKLGLRAPLPPKQNRKLITDYPIEVQERHLHLYLEVEEILSKYRATGKTKTREEIFGELAIKYGKSKETIAKKYSNGKKVNKNLKQH